MTEEIALFPLDYVLLPGLPLPLHVFEPRYRQLVTDAAAGAASGHGSFGVVLGHAPARTPSQPLAPRLASGASGNAMGARMMPAELAEIGTVAEILENEPYADGRCDLLTVGSRRFRILDVDETSRPYLWASVEYLDEPGGEGSTREFDRTGRLIHRYLDQLGEVSDSIASTVGVDMDPAQVARFSYEVAARIQLTTAERQMLLACATASDRLGTEIALLRRELAIFATVRAVPVPARMLVVGAGLN